MAAHSSAPPRSPRRRVELRRGVPLALLALFMLTACRTPPPPRIDTAAPGWTPRSGQAVWTPARGADEVVVDLNTWHRAGGECLLDVSKAALTFVLAHVSSEHWRIETTGGRRHTGRGPPPARAGWLQLARALAGRQPAAPWRFERREAGAWRLVNPGTGECFEGSLPP